MSKEAGVDVFGYFNNHFAGHSPASVRQFAGMLAQQLGGSDGADAGQMPMGLSDE